MGVSRREFLIRSAQAGGGGATVLAARGLGAQTVLRSTMEPNVSPGGASAEKSLAELDGERMRSIAAWTSLTLETPSPVPFGADILNSATGERLMRAVNAVRLEHDPSAHAETRCIRLACKQLEGYSLKGYTLYTTCEPCPMCMACALWAGIDRVVYGATIADANRFTLQIQIPATEVAKRSDMKCEVVGPVEREACVAIFEHPNMQKAFKMWSSKRTRD